MNGMGSSVAGDPLWGVLIPPQLARFRALAGIGEAPLAVDFTGWNKFVVLSHDRAFLFPRHGDNVEWFEREVSVYEALAATGLEVVPRLVQRWQDDSVYPFPFVAVTRLPGTHPNDAAELMAQLGRAVASMARGPATGPSGRASARPSRSCRHAVAPAGARPHDDRAAVAEAAARLDRGDRLTRWTEAARDRGSSSARPRARRRPRGPAARSRRATDGRARLGDGPHRPSVLGLRLRRMGRRALARPSTRLHDAVVNRVARVRRKSAASTPTPRRWRPRSGCATRSHCSTIRAIPRPPGPSRAPAGHPGVSTSGSG